MSTLPPGNALPPKDHVAASNSPSTTNIQPQEKNAWAPVPLKELSKMADEMETMKGSAPSLKGRVSFSGILNAITAPFSKLWNMIFSSKSKEIEESYVIYANPGESSAIQKKFDTNMSVSQARSQANEDLDKFAENLAGMMASRNVDEGDIERDDIGEKIRNHLIALQEGPILKIKKEIASMNDPIAIKQKLDEAKDSIMNRFGFETQAAKDAAIKQLNLLRDQASDEARELFNKADAMRIALYTAKAGQQLDQISSELQESFDNDLAAFGIKNEEFQDAVENLNENQIKAKLLELKKAYDSVESTFNLIIPEKR